MESTQCKQCAQTNALWWSSKQSKVTPATETTNWETKFRQNDDGHKAAVHVLKYRHKSEINDLKKELDK
eukprot:3483087-Rhodomonas_salina.1